MSRQRKFFISHYFYYFLVLSNMASEVVKSQQYLFDTKALQFVLTKLKSVDM